MRKLERFLNSVIKNPILLYNPIFLAFISIEEEKEWILKQTLYTIETPCKVEDIFSLYGNIHYNITPESEELFTNLKDHIDNNDKVLNHLISLYKDLFSHIDEMVSKINAITEVWKQLQEISKIFKTSQLEKIYKTMSNSSYKLSKTWKVQKSIFNIEIKEFLKYYNNELKVLKDLTYKCNDYQNQYYREYNQLVQKKEYLFNKQMSRWGVEKDKNAKEFEEQKKQAFEMMFLEETKNALCLKQWYGMFLKEVVSEYNRLKQVYLDGHKKMAGSFGNKNLQIINELQISFADLVTLSNL